MSDKTSSQTTADSNNAAKSSSIVLIHPLENINKELIYQQRLKRPFNVIQNLPISKDKSGKLPDYTTLSNPLSVKDTSVLYTSLIVSRFNWLNHIFNTYWTKREQLIIGSNNYKKDKMFRLCDAELNCGVHTFNIKLFFLKDDLREKAFKEEIERKREERNKRKQEKIDEMNRKREERERLEKEKLEREQKEKELKEQEEKEKEKEQNALKENQTTISNTTITTDTKVVENKDKATIIPITTDKTNEPIKAPIETVIKPTELPEKESSSSETKSSAEKPTIIEPQSNEKPVEKETTENLAKPVEKPVETPTKKPIEQAKTTKFTTSSTPIKSNTSQSPSTTPIDSDNSQVKPKITTKVLLSNPENAIMIQNLNYLAKNDLYLNNLMKDVAGGGASSEQISEFQKYIQKARAMGDLKKLSDKIKNSSMTTTKKGKDITMKTSIIKNNVEISKPLINMTPEEIKKKEEEVQKRLAEMKIEHEKQRLERQRVKEEKEQEKIRLREEREKKKLLEKEEREKAKELLRKQKEMEKEMKKQQRQAEKEKIMLKRQQKLKEKQMIKDNEKLKLIEREKEKEKDKLNDDVTDFIDYDELDDRMGKLTNTEQNDDLWNDKLSPLQERYSTNAHLIFEFTENNAARFEIPKDCIYEIIDNEEDSDNNNVSKEESPKVNGEIKLENSETSRKSPYVTILASFLLVHNEKEIKGWERRREEEEKEKLEKEKAAAEARIKKEEIEQQQTQDKPNKRKRKTAKSWGTNKRATRASKQAKQLENLRREEENYFEEDDELRKEQSKNSNDRDENSDVKPIPIYSPLTIKFTKIPFRFSGFITNSGNSPEVSRENMKIIMNLGKRVPLDQLWYQVDGINDELLAETLRYNLNRLDYANSSLKKSRIIFQKKFGKGGRNN